MDPSVVMGPPPPYPYPVPVPVPSAPIPIHPLQPFPFFRSQASGAVHNLCHAYMPYSSPCNPQAEHSSAQQHPHQQPGTSRSQTSSQQDSGSKSSNPQQRSGAERSDDFSDVVTELALKTPGSAGTSSHSKVAKDQVRLLIGSVITNFVQLSFS